MWRPQASVYGVRAGNEALLNRFVDATGFDASQLRDQSTRPEFSVALLDLILANEPGRPRSGELACPAAGCDWPGRNTLAKKAGIPLEEFPS